MKHGFIKIAAVTPDMRVADPVYNTDVMIEEMKQAAQKGAKVIVFPELSISGYSCEDLFLQELLLEESRRQLCRMAKETESLDALVLAGLPFEHRNRLYNVEAALHRGKILGLIPKRNIPNYSEFYEARHFTPGPKNPE